MSVCDHSRHSSAIDRRLRRRIYSGGKFQLTKWSQANRSPSWFNPSEGRGNYSATSNNVTNWYNGCGWMGCCIWYSEEGTGRAAVIIIIIIIKEQIKVT